MVFEPNSNPMLIDGYTVNQQVVQLAPFAHSQCSLMIAPSISMVD
jgi:hypothetical protein